MKNILPILLISAICASACIAETNKKEFATIGRILSLSRDIPVGALEIAIVYDPNSPTSTADMRAIKAIVSTKTRAPKHNISVIAVPIHEALHITSPVVWATEGLGQNQEKVRNLSEFKKALTISSDISCVEAGNCVLGVDISHGIVRIVMNSTLYKTTQLSFDAAFEFMVKQI